MDPLHAATVGIVLFAMVLWGVGRFVIGRQINNVAQERKLLSNQGEPLSSEEDPLVKLVRGKLLELENSSKHPEQHLPKVMKN